MGIFSGIGKSVGASGVKSGISQTAKLGIQKSAETAAKSAAKASIKESAKQALLKAKDFIVKLGKTGAANAKMVAKKALQTSGDALEASKKFALNNRGKVLAGIAAGTAAGIAYDHFTRLNDKSFSIKSIVPKQLGGVLGIGAKDVLYIEYIDPDKDKNKLRITDIIVITDSDSNETADGTYIILSSNNNIPSITVGKQPEDSTPMPKIKKNGENGTFVYKTTFQSQVEGIVGDALGDTADIVGGAALNVLDNTFDNLGLGEYTTYIYIFIGFIIFVVVVGILYKAYDIFSSRQSANQITNEPTSTQTPPPAYAQMTSAPPTAQPNNTA